MCFWFWCKYYVPPPSFSIIKKKDVTGIFENVTRNPFHLQEWWTHLWLNEGFASWIEYLCVDNCFPDYDIWTQFTTQDYTRALVSDALLSSHPIEVCSFKNSCYFYFSKYQPFTKKQLYGSNQKLKTLERERRVESLVRIIFFLLSFYFD